MCGEACNFTISTKNAGSGGLSLAVEGPSKAEISCNDNKDGTVSVSYLPLAPGEYKVSVKYADKHIRGSPYTAKITGEGRKRNQISVGSNSEVPLPGRVADADIRALNASIQAPSGLEEPCFLKMLPNGNLGISFTPREVGDHYVSVKRLGKHIQGSPFKIKVGEREVGDAKKVIVSGKALLEGKTHTDNTFNIDTRKAGYGGLSLSIEGPSKAEIKCKDNEDGTLDISYRPTEPGYYIMNLKFADHHVDGSPYTIKVTGEGSNTQTERIKRERAAVPQTEVGSKCRLAFKIPGVSTMDLSACVTSPSGQTEGADIAETEDGGYGVSFVPSMLGVHSKSFCCWLTWWPRLIIDLSSYLQLCPSSTRTCTSPVHPSSLRLVHCAMEVPTESTLVVRASSAENKASRASSTFGLAKLVLDRWPSRLKDPARPTSTLRIARTALATSFTTFPNQVLTSLSLVANYRIIFPKQLGQCSLGCVRNGSWDVMTGESFPAVGPIPRFLAPQQTTYKEVAAFLAVRYQSHN